MMGVYIKNMEMPKNCFDCMFHWHGDGTTYCLAQSKMHDLHHIKWQCKGYEEQMKYREPTCPLISVPPHGRLIDGDALKAEGWELVKMESEIYNGKQRMYQVGIELDDAPTVIESEGE